MNKFQKKVCKEAKKLSIRTYFAWDVCKKISRRRIKEQYKY